MDSRFSGAHSIIMQGIRSTMTVPLLHRDEILGIMHLDSQIATNAFTEKDLQICTGMAAQAAIAIQNARLATRIEHEAQTRAQISRLIPPSVVEQVVKGELTIEKGGRLQRDHHAVLRHPRLHRHVRRHARPTRSSTPSTSTSRSWSRCCSATRGTLDKFVGDEIIGLFGAPIQIDDAPFKAVACALDMLKSLREFNRTRAVRESAAPS